MSIKHIEAYKTPGSEVEIEYISGIETMEELDEVLEGIRTKVEGELNR